MTAFFYETYEQTPTELVARLQDHLKENGDELINLRDSTGNYFLHNVCMALKDTESLLLEEVIRFLLSSAVV